MSKNHRNRSWRAKWVVDEATGIARHTHGVVAAVIDGEVMVDVTQYRSRQICLPDVFRRQAEKLFEELLEPRNEPRM